MSARVLVVDDEKSILEFFEILLAKEGLEAVCAESGQAAMQKIGSGIFDLVISDVSMPGMTGLELLQQLKQTSPDTAVILITAYGTTETAVEAMKQGAVDYILKPFKVDEIKLVIHTALERNALYRENVLLKRQLKARLGFSKLIGSSRTMLEVYAMIERLAKNRSNVLLTGGSGTGKELVARAIHDQGERRDAPFVSVNCGAIPENLIESELFGHMKGAFTGAVMNKRGLMEVAERGTFFFDEVGELPQQTQVKLLRVLQEKKIRRVGGTEDIPIECRIVAATNKELDKEVAAGRFREDLYYRLNVFNIKLPRLSERVEDIPMLVQHFIKKYTQEHDKHLDGIEPAALRYFERYPFPGNVRELENLVEQAVAMSNGEVIVVNDLPAALRLGNALAPVEGGKSTAQHGTLDKVREGECDLQAELDAFEKGLLLEALRVAGGVKKEAAKILHISFRSIRYRLLKLGIETNRFAEENEEKSEEKNGL